jgi:predicted thioesterase
MPPTPDPHTVERSRRRPVLRIVGSVPAETGVSATAELVVGDADTAIVLGSGDVPVLGTPRLLALCEEASCAAVEGHLAPEETTVGLRVELTHLAPTGVGSRVRAEATLERCEGRRLVFAVSAFDDGGLVAAGKVTRVVVSRSEFLDKVR